MSEPQEPLDHNTAMARIIETGDTEDVQMILGHKDRLRCGGVIRTGIKVLKSGASQNEIALFKELEDQGLPYDTIDEKLGGKPRSRDSKLYPKNADHFVVRACDFTRQSDAEHIMQKYADPDGKLRRLPVWLSVGEIDKVLHHGFKTFNGAGKVIAASFYEGKDLKVRYLPKGFKDVPKRDDWKIAPLDPDNPVSPAGHKLEFGGIFRFNIPGLRGFDEVIIATKSWYGISYSVALLRRVRSVLGRFNGLLNGEAFLEIAKVPEDVTDPKGNRVTQFIPVIDLSIDPMELARHAEMAPSRGMTAIAMFNGRRPSSPPPSECTAPPADQHQDPADEAPFDDEDPAIGKLLEYLHNAAKWLGVPWEAFESYVVHDFPKPVSQMSADELREVCTEVKQKTKEEKDHFAAYISDIHRLGSDEKQAQSADELPFN
jgi:hypothetical protein